MADQPTYAKINYGLRPAKHIERRMIFQVLRKLDHIADLTTYRYVGFGSPFFVDFRLAHRDLGVSRMTNIESAEVDEPRFEFNRPFGCVELRYGGASEVLDELDWEERTILWLDYDKALSTQQINEVRQAIGILASGSVLLVSTNCHPVLPLDRRVEVMRRILGEYMPFDVEDPDLLGGWKTGALYYKILASAIEDELSVRNEGSQVGTQMQFRQWFNFHYADGAKMLTVGGLLVDQGLANQANGLGVEAVPFVRTGPEPYEIGVPTLTMREMAHLESRFPLAAGDVGLDFLPADDVAAYGKVYRYFPRYADVDV